jgi:hypothetical protein
MPSNANLAEHRTLSLGRDDGIRGGPDRDTAG